MLPGINPFIPRLALHSGIFISLRHHEEKGDLSELVQIKIIYKNTPDKKFEFGGGVATGQNS